LKAVVVKRTIAHMRTPLRKGRIKLEHKIQYRNPLQVEASQRVKVAREDDQFPGWRWCTASDGREGWVPIELLSGEGAEATMQEDYSARELAVKPGEEVIIEEARHGWLLVRNIGGERGWIPASNVEPQ